MKKISKPVLIWIGVAAGVLVLTALIAGFLTWDSQREKTAPVTEIEAPVSEVQKSVKAIPAHENVTGTEYDTGWTQLEDSIEISLTGPDNCPPQVEKASMKEKSLSIWLKAVPYDCSRNLIVNYFSIQDAKDIETVEVYEAGQSKSFKLNKK